MASSGLIDIQPADAAFAGSTRETTEAIKAWVLSEINQRMELAGRAVDFLNTLDVKRQELEQHATQQVNRVSTIVEDLEKTKSDVLGVFEKIKAKMDTVDVQLQSVPEITRRIDVKTGQIDELFKKTDSLLKEKTEQIQTNEKKLDELHEKTRVFADKITSDLETMRTGLIGQTTQLRDDIMSWSDGYAGRIEAMVKGGDFKYERGPSVQKGKFDKKEVSVWQIPAGVSKPDFRH